MNERVSARHRPQLEVMKAYREYLDMEEKAGDELNGEVGRAKEPKRRAMELVAVDFGYSSWESVLVVVRRWEKQHGAQLETWGMELEHKFSEAVRLIQDGNDKLLEACDFLEDGVAGLDGREEYADIFGEIREKLQVNRPRCLCPACKGVVNDCDVCEGDGWFDEVEEGTDGRLLDSEDIHVESMGVVIRLEDYRP